MRPLLLALSSIIYSGPALAVSPDVADAVAQGDCATVIAALPSPSDEGDRLALGWCLRHEDPERALELLPETGVGVLSDYGRWQRAEILLELSRFDEAIRALDGVKLPGEPGLAVRLVRGRALIGAGRSLDARPDLRALLETTAADEARYWLAVGGRDRGDNKAAIATFRRTWANSVRGPWSDRSAQALAELGVPVPDYGSVEGRALASDRVKSLQASHQHVEALNLIRDLREAEGLEAADASLALALFRARKYPEANASWEELLGKPDVATGAPESMFHYALGVSRTGDYATAATIYTRLQRAHPDTRRGDEASYKLGYLAYDSGDCGHAVPAFEQHLRRYPSSRFLESALWFTGRCHWRSGSYEDAEAAWDRLLKARPKSSLAAAVMYWRARKLGVQGQEEAEQRALRELLSRYPISGHAWFAAARLEHRFPPREAVSRPAWPSALAKLAKVQRSEALLSSGFTRWAMAELSGLEQDAKAHGKEGILAAAHALIATGAYRRGAALAKPYCVSPWKDGDPVAQQACHPRAEARIVSTTAQRYGLPELVPFGIMWSESAMTPDVTSIAGARGLMQLMPAEGPRLHAEAFGKGQFDPDNLYLASYNARLGTTELGTKFRALQGVLETDSLPAAIASYNAGEEAVRRWLPEDGAPLAFDTFAEDISYTETRRYVRGVLGHYMTYRWVYGDR